jgi:hypothetical protein
MVWVELDLEPRPPNSSPLWLSEIFLHVPNYMLVLRPGQEPGYSQQLMSRPGLRRSAPISLQCANEVGLQLSVGAEVEADEGSELCSLIYT